jgi:hypothetical protein
MPFYKGLIGSLALVLAFSAIIILLDKLFG